jgi:fermentation-respiration switch protein FrsA (DUF1100 family)
MSSHFASLAWILQYGYDYLIFDYRGYWKTEGKPSPENTVKDGITVLKYARDHAPGTPLVIFAQSLGGAIALRSYIDAKNEIPARLVVIDSSFASYKSVGRDVLSRSWLTWIFQPLASVLLSDQWAPGKRVREVSPTPLLVMHGDLDQVISFKQGEKLFEAAAEPKEFWKIEGGYHTDAFWRHKGIYRQRFLEKLESMFGPASMKPGVRPASGAESKKGAR